MSATLRFQRTVKPAVQHPAAIATISALLYVFLSSIYIVVSGRWAASLAETAEQLTIIEMYKGIAFMVFSGLLFFVITFFLLKRTRRQEDVIIRQEVFLLQAERKAVASMLAASMAHDLNNLLMSLYGLVEGIKEKEAGDEFLTAMREAVEKGVEKVTRLAKHVSASTKQETLETCERIELRESVGRLIELARKHPDLRDCDIRHEEIPPTVLRLNTLLFEEAVLNLLINAGQASSEGGRIVIRIRDECDAVILEVHDNGPGIDPEQLETIFRPCFTTKPNGTGLGLLAVQNFVNSCNGEVIIDRSELGGAKFAVKIPK